MAAVPAGLDTDSGPPLRIPMRHFFVGLGFLMLGIALGLVQAFDVAFAGTRLAHVHLLLVGWICLTILGAMTQFVPVWSGTRLHSKRLANVQLVLASVGVAGLASGLLFAENHLLATGGIVLALAFWTFVYNVGRTLLTVRPWDDTQRHFAFALACFVAVPVLGLAMAVDRITPFLGTNFPGVLGAHVTLAVFGAILATVAGALYQLGTMFTQTELDAFDRRLQRVETIGYPLGVVTLAGGRLVGEVWIARLGGLLVAGGLLALAVVLGRRLAAAQVPRTPMLTRYAVVVPALSAWAVLAGWTWLDDPLSRAALLGPADAGLLLAVGAVGFVVLGSLYHVLPFLVWMHRYSDMLGIEPTPAIDDLYDDRIATVDLVCVLFGALGLLVGSALDVAMASAVGGLLLAFGLLLAAANLGLAVSRHAPEGFGRELLGLS